MTTASTTLPVHHPSEGAARALAGLAAAGSLAYAFLLGWRADGNGVAVAAAFATGLLFASYALGGVLPSSVKVGNVELQLQQARDEGRVDGLQKGTQISAKVAAGELHVDDVVTALHHALTSPDALRVDSLHVAVPQLPASTADSVVDEVEKALRGVA